LLFVIVRVAIQAIFASCELAYKMKDEQPNNPLHGITLKSIVEALVERHGWEELALLVRIRCFAFDPSLKSSLTFLRRTEWARKEVEALYLADRKAIERERRKENRGTL